MKNKWALVIVGLVVLVVVSSIILVMKVSPQQSIIPSQCLMSTGGTTSGSFTCPSDASSCIATVKLSCTSSSSSPRVIFRTDGNWIAYDYANEGHLTCYSIKSTPSPNCNIPYNTKLLIPTLSPLMGGKYLYGSPTTVFTKNKEVDTNYCGDVRYLVGTGCNTQISPQGSGYYEINSPDSTNVYQCSQSVTGSKTKVISYAGSVPGTSSDSFSLNPRETISWAGSIEYTISKTQTSECTKNVKVSSNTYYQCVTDVNGCGILDKTEVQSCGNLLFDESTGLCVTPTTCIASNGQTISKGSSLCTSETTLETCTTPPTIVKQTAPSGKICKNNAIGDAYTVSTTLSANVLSTSDKLKADFTSDLPGKDVTATIYVQGSSAVRDYKTQQTTSTGKTTFTFDPLEVGYYTVKITFSDTHGNYEKDYDFQVASALTITLRTDNPIQYDNEPIEVFLNSYQSGSLKDLKDKQVEATFNGVSIQPETITHPSLGVLGFYYKVSGDGNLRVRAKGENEASLWTDWTDYFQVTVKKASIIITSDFQDGQCVGQLTNKFYTKNPQGGYVSTTNLVQISTPTGNTITPTISGNNGKYSFVYNFQEGGLYIIEITSSNNELGSSQLNSGLGEPISVLIGGTCGSNGGISTTIPWTTIGIFGGLIAGIVLFVFLLRRKK